MASRSRALVYGYASSGCSETLRGRLSNASRFGSFSMTMSESHSFAGSTNDAVFFETLVTQPCRGLCAEMGACYRYHSMRRAV